MQELIPINVLIGDRTYRVKIQARDEETIRKTLKVINDQIIEFKAQFSGKDMQDYIAMVLLWYATQLSSEERNPVLTPSLMETLSRMEQQLDRVI